MAFSHNCSPEVIKSLSEYARLMTHEEVLDMYAIFPHKEIGKSIRIESDGRVISQWVVTCRKSGGVVAAEKSWPGLDEWPGAV
jgi:hypothetical protein